MNFITQIKKPHWIATILTFILVGIFTIQNYVLDTYEVNGVTVSFYNNYLIFKQSFFSLIENLNLYTNHRPIHVDYFKYSPTFALFFGLFAPIPTLLGLFIWNMLNALVFYVIWQMDLSNQKNKFWIWAFMIVEFLTNVQSSQSNGIMAGLIILAYLFLEKKNVVLATLMVVLSVYIKLFGLVTFALFLFYPDKIKAILYAALWGILLFLLPLIVVSPAELIQQYENWLNLLIIDEARDYSPSVMGWLNSWFHIYPSGKLLTGLGIIMFLIPFTQIKKYSNPVFKQLILASILIWVVIFNHKAESPTFIIAVSGVAIWFFCQKPNPIHWALLMLTVVFKQLSPTDLFPPNIRNGVFIPYVIKVVPVILVWFKVIYDATFLRLEDSKKG